jgi:hypothetical protein
MNFSRGVLTFRIFLKSLIIFFNLKEYGGDAGTVQVLREANLKMVLAHRDYFIEDEQYGVDEKKRTGKPKSQETLFGVDGTFRQLQID